MNTFCAWIITIAIIILVGLILAFALVSVRKNALKQGALVAFSGVMMVLLSFFKKDPPKNNKKIELAERTKKDFDKELQ